MKSCSSGSKIMDHASGPSVLRIFSVEVVSNAERDGSTTSIPMSKRVDGLSLKIKKYLEVTFNFPHPGLRLPEA